MFFRYSSAAMQVLALLLTLESETYSQTADQDRLGMGPRVHGRILQRSRSEHRVKTSSYSHGGATSLVGVRRLVPQQYTTIQSAINASVHGDTVLVADSTYYENIKFRGKRIIVASHFLIDGDTSHITRTIINGSQPSHADSGSVVAFLSGEDTTSTICGFTITGGTGTVTEGGAWREGGGVLCMSPAKVCHNRVISNHIIHSGNGWAGGIASDFVGTGYVIIENNEVLSNSVTGGDYSGGGGMDIYSNARIIGNRVLNNTLSSTAGAGGGGMEAGNEGGWLIATNNLVRGNSLIGMGEGNAWIDGGGGYFYDGGFGVTPPGTLDLAGNIIDSNRTNGRSTGGTAGCGLALSFVNALLDRNRIADNKEQGIPYSCPGSGVWGGYSSVKFTNNIIVRNTAVFNGGVGPSILLGMTSLVSPPSQAHLLNNTIVDNNGNVTIASFGGTPLPVIVLNSIVWGYGAGSIEVTGNATAQVQYSNIQTGWVGTGNINVNPQFADPSYRLASTSPCIGSGMDSIQVEGTWHRAPLWDFSGLNRPMPSGTRPDMGAWEDQTVVTGVEESSNFPVSFSLTQNYPNPFNPSTTIRYSIPVGMDGLATLRVYDLLGREVATLVNEAPQPGTYETQWDASGVASGVYLYKLTAGQFGQFTETKRLVLLR